MMLQQILVNTEDFDYMLIVDSLQTKHFTSILLKKILTSSSNRCICLIAAEKPAKYYQQITANNNNNSSEVRIVDEFSLDESRLQHRSSSSNNNSGDVKTLLQRINNELQDTKKAVKTVVVDSMSALVLRYGLQGTYAVFQSLIQQHNNNSNSNSTINKEGATATSSQVNVVCVVHRDTHTNLQLNCLKHNAKAIVSLFEYIYGGSGIEDTELNLDKLNVSGKSSKQPQPQQQAFRSSSSTSSKNTCDFMCECLTMRNNAKLMSTDEYFNVDVHTGALISVKNPQEIVSGQLQAGTKQSKPQDEIDKQVPFKLSLSDKERAAKDAVVLPHTQEGKKFAATSNGPVVNNKGKPPSQKGAILFNPEDEYDLEDPDDDLDI